MEVSETAAGANLQKSSSSTSETVNETVVKKEETKVVNGESESKQTVSVAATVALAPAENGTDKPAIETEEMIEVIEVTDDESGEEVEEVVEKTTTKSTTKTPAVAKAASVETPSEKSIPGETSAPKTIDRQSTAEAEESATEEEEEEEEEEEVEQVALSKPVESAAKEPTIAAEPEDTSKAAEPAAEPVEEAKAQEDVVDSMAQLRIEEAPEKATSQAAPLATAPSEEAVQRPVHYAGSIPQAIPVQQTAPVQQTTLVQQATPPVQATPPSYSQPASYARPNEGARQIPQENIRNQLQEIVSDIDRAVEEHKIFGQMPPQSLQSYSTQNSSTTETFKKTTSSAILQPPSYFYQEENAPNTPSSLSKPDLQKIFTPANDAEVILPNKNRKNENVNLNGYGDYQMPSKQFSEEKSYSTQRYESKIPLKLVMDPRGVVQDVHSQGITYDHSSGMLSPDKCAELVSALHTDAPKGKGAELFAKRRKRSEKWIVDETTRSANNPAVTSYSAGPTQIYDTNQYNQMGYQAVDNQAPYQQPPWEAQREVQRKDDFYRDNMYSSSPGGFKPQYQPAPALPAYSYSLPKQSPQPLKRIPNNLRDLAYKPSIPQGWNAPPPNLPNEMFTPPEIPLSGYTPPRSDLYFPPSTTSYHPHQYDSTYAPPSDYQPMSSVPPPTFKRIDPSQVYSAQFPVQNFTPKPFTPSPIAQEKLAIFEQSRDYQPPVIRRPLTAPNQRVKNVSPAPFSGSPHFDSYQNAPWSASQNRLSGCSFTSSTSNYNTAPSSMPMAAPPSPRLYDMSHQENYNRAARGWGHSKGFYQSVNFSKPPKVELPYTDF